jgi:hypothetical protein
MSDGYIFGFSNRTFAEFVVDITGRDITEEKYNYASGSKANRLRGFWAEENNGLVGKLMGELIEYGLKTGNIASDHPDLASCRRTVARLLSDNPVPELDALSAASEERDFDIVAKAVREAIERNEPEGGLDRLHTFAIKYLRSVCAQAGITVTKEKPLHSLLGEYVKALQAAGASNLK